MNTATFAATCNDDESFARFKSTLHVEVHKQTKILQGILQFYIHMYMHDLLRQQNLKKKSECIYFTAIIERIAFT